MEYVLAALIFGAIVVFIVPYGQSLLGQFIPTSLASNTIVQLLLTGGIIVIAVIAAHKLGLGKYLRKAD